MTNIQEVAIYCGHPSKGTLASLILSLGLLFLLPSSQLAQDYSASGNVSMTHYTENSLVRKSDKFRFQFRSENDSWYIKMWPSARTSAYIECGFDGSFLRTHIPIPDIGEAKFVDATTGLPITPPPNLKKGPGTASISKRRIPRVPGMAGITAVWFGLAESIQPKSIGQQMEPLFLTAAFGHDTEELFLFDIDQRVYVERHRDVVRKLVTLNSGVIHGWKNPNDFWQSTPLNLKYHHPFDKGFTNCVYEAIEFQDLSDLIIPTKFQFQLMTPPHSSSTNTNTYLQTQLHVVVEEWDTETKQDEATDYVPHVPNEIIVTDRRFESSTNPVFAFSYTSTNGWLEEHEVKLLPEYQWQIQAQYPETQFGTKRPSSAIGALLIVLSVAGLILLVVACNRAPTKAP